jgi:parvulin-like peptidyl-prolyl isomerase
MAATADEEASSKALFVINGDPVYAREFRIFIETVYPEERENLPAMLGQLADAFINNRLMAEKAAKGDIAKNPRVRSRIETRVNPIWRDVYWSEVVKPTIRVRDEDLLRKASPMEEMISLQQLIVNSRKEAEDLRARALEGEDFGEIIRKHSIGITASKGGMVGFVKRDSQMYSQELLKELFSGKVGEITPVKETRLGFSVIRIVERKTAEQLKKEWLEGNRERLVRQREKEIWEEWKENLSREHEVVVHREVVDAYHEAREKNAPFDKLMEKYVVTIDGIPLSLADIVDPSGMGVIHGETTMDLIVRKRLDNFAIDRDMEKRGLKEKFPDIVIQEKCLREHILAREYVDFRSRDLRGTEKELRDFYRERKDRYVLPRALDLSFIETRSESRVKKIYEELQKGIPFEEVADKWSDSKLVKGGRAGFIEEAKLASDLSSVKSLKVGEYSQAALRLRSKQGGREIFVIPKLNAIREERRLAFDEVDRYSLEKAFMANKREAVIKEILSELRRDNEVEVTSEFENFGKYYVKKMPHSGGER